MKKIIITALLLFSIFQVFWRDFNINYYENTATSVPDLFYLPDARYLKPFTLGYDYLAADIVWIKTIGYFADQFESGRDYRYLEKLLIIMADLDPMFEKTFIWGGSVLMYNGNQINRKSISSSTRYLKYVWDKIKEQKISYKHDEEYWRIPQMIGFNYAIELKQPGKGIPYIEEVARIPGSPSFYRTWVSTLYNRSGNKEKALVSLERELIIENLKAALAQNLDEEVKALIFFRLKKYYSELYDESYAKNKIRELVAQVQRLTNVYNKHFAFIPLELFFVLDAERFVEADQENMVDKLYYDEKI